MPCARGLGPGSPWPYQKNKNGGQPLSRTISTPKPRTYGNTQFTRRKNQKTLFWATPVQASRASNTPTRKKERMTVSVGVRRLYGYPVFFSPLRLFSLATASRAYLPPTSCVLDGCLRVLSKILIIIPPEQGNKMSSTYVATKMGLRTNRPGLDERYTRPQGLYHHGDVDLRKLKKLIVSGKLAPCYPGQEGRGRAVYSRPRHV